MRVEPYQPSAKDSWDAFVRTGKNANFLFQRDYMEYHGDRFVDHSLMFYQDDRLVGCLPANQVEDVLYSHQGLTFGAVVVDDKLRLTEMFEVFSTLRAYMKSHRLRQFVYRAMPYTYHRLPAEEDLYALHHFGAEVIDVKATCALLVGGPMKFNSTKRRELSLAKRAGVIASRNLDFVGFMHLCADALRKRHRTNPTHSGEEMRYLSGIFPDNIQLYTATRGPALVAGIIIYRNAACCRGQYVAQSSEGKEVFAEGLVFDYLLREVLEPGSWFDFGHSMDPATGGLNEGLISFKESLGGRTVAQLTFAMSVD